MTKRAGVPLEILMAVAGSITLAAVLGFFRTGTSDFQMFYASGVAWLQNQPLYTADHPNLNPPLAVVALFAPLGRLPYPIAQTIWLMLQILALLASWRVIASELHLTRRQVLVLTSCVGLTYPAWLTWYQGQMMWLLLYPATLSWRAFRRGDEIQTGAWFAPVIVLKPPLALVALFLPRRVCAAAGACSLAVTAMGVLWIGATAWTTWLRFGSQVTWLSWVDNVSIWGLVTRVRSGSIWGGQLGDIPVAAAAAVLVPAAVVWWGVSREADRDRRMALAVMVGVFLSPLGWVYYLTIGLGAFIASWPGTRLAWSALALLCIPFPIVYMLTLTGPVFATVIGSMYAAALLCAVLAWTQRPTVEGVAPEGLPVLR